MALDGSTFSPKEFKLAISSAGEGTQGTKQTDALRAINIDSLEMPSFNPTQVLDARSGTDGRIADVDDIFVDQKGIAKEITFSGVFDQTIAPLLVQNCLATAVSSNVITIPYNYEPPALATGATSQNIIHTVTLFLTLPATTDASSGADNHCIVFPGCTITNLQITGDMGSESGRLRFTATARTGHVVEFAQSAVSPSAYGTSFYSLATFAGTGAKTIAGATDCVIQSFSLNMENPSEYVGQHDANGNPEAIVRATPELLLNLDATVKYDNNNAADAQTTAEYATAMNSKTTVGTELYAHASDITAASGFGFEADYGQITSAAFNEANAMMMDVSVKFFASGSNNVFRIRF